MLGSAERRHRLSFAQHVIDAQDQRVAHIADVPVGVVGGELPVVQPIRPPPFELCHRLVEASAHLTDLDAVAVTLHNQYLPESVGKMWARVVTASRSKAESMR